MVAITLINADNFDSPAAQSAASIHNTKTAVQSSSNASNSNNNNSNNANNRSNLPKATLTPSGKPKEKRRRCEFLSKTNSTKSLTHQRSSSTPFDMDMDSQKTHLLHCFKKGSRTNDTADVCGNGTTTILTVRDWFKKFGAGNLDLKNEGGTGRLIKSAVAENPRYGVPEIKQYLLIFDSVQTHGQNLISNLGNHSINS
uniref:Mos1 transposase HTH domain-containing protein n=1 Tax=Glossina pallidipes TaxID=7398 RepID=A0A1A9ZF79_GLOPL